MAKNWTRQQENAINATGGTVLVSAAAGSGKTAVLVERVIRLISGDNPIDIDRLLIVTFTRAAAKEMRDRIMQALSDLLEHDPSNQNLLRQRRLLHSASICTIDSFCGDLVREYFHSPGVARDFRIADEGELDILNNSALDSALSVFYERNEPPFGALLDVFADKNGDARLRGVLLKLQTFLEAVPFPQRWLDGAIKDYKQTEPSKTVWGVAVMEYAHEAAAHALNVTENSVKLAERDEKLMSAFSPMLEDYRTYFTRLQCALFDGGWDKIRSIVMSFEPGRLATPRGYKDDPIKKAVENNRAEIKKTVENLAVYFACDKAEIAVQLKELYPIMATLFELENEYLSRLWQLKSAKNLLSFSDVELLAVKLLAEPSGENGYVSTKRAAEVAARFDGVMVDEFQDINDVQDIIFRAVSGGEKHLFAVGDVKQSIYGFRQAKPEIFMARKIGYARYEDESPTYPATIILDKNFRSRAEVCDAVNFIFARLMNKKTAKMDYGADERLVNGALFEPSENCGFELALVETGESDAAKAELEAQYIAEKIHRMRASGFTVKCGDGVRPVEYGDFAVILRSAKNTAAVYVNVLGRYLIPAYSENKTSFFDAPEIKIMLNLLRTVDNPCSGIPLLSVLCSPVYGFTPDELADMRAGRQNENLYASVCAYAERGCGDKSRKFLSDLKELRACACTMGIDELIFKALELTGFGSLALAAGETESALKNLELLREYARGYESRGVKTLSDFVTYIDKLVENKTALSASAPSGVDYANAVRVLSIHASKGLEFPVVFLADAAHGFNKTDLKEDLLIDGEAGVGIKIMRGQIKYKTFPHYAAALRLNEALVAEELRVLYVALTRAKEKLIAVGSCKDADKYISSQYSKLVFESEIEPFAVTGSGSYLDWLTMCALVHPSQNALRRSAAPGAKPIVSDGASLPWNVEIIKPESIGEFGGAELDEAAENNLLEPVDLNSSLADDDCALRLKKSLEFKYKNAEVLNLPQKVSASDIAHRQNGEYFDKIIAKPMFLLQHDSSAVKRGTAHHLFLQYCSFTRARENLDGELMRLKNEGRLTDEQLRLIDKSMLSRFLSSELADRIIHSPLVMREKRFTARLAPSLVFDEYKNVQTDVPVIVQGAVDLTFEENDSLIVVDYKTDRVSSAGKLSDLYSKQLEIYKAAMEQTEEKRVSECVIFSLHLGEYIKVAP